MSKNIIQSPCYNTVDVKNHNVLLFNINTVKKKKTTYGEVAEYYAKRLSKGPGHKTTETTVLRHLLYSNGLMSFGIATSKMFILSDDATHICQNG